jgi:hypothetical protein
LREKEYKEELDRLTQETERQIDESNRLIEQRKQMDGLRGQDGAVYQFTMADEIAAMQSQLDTVMAECPIARAESHRQRT